MNPEENEKRIIYLSNKYRDSDINSINDDYIELIQYLKNNCELCLRLILKKHYNGEPLNEEEQEKINKYLFFSNPNLFSPETDGPTFTALILQSTYGAREFSDDEREKLMMIKNDKTTR